MEAWGLTRGWGLAHIDYFPLWAAQSPLLAARSGHQLGDSGLSPRVELALPPLSLPQTTPLGYRLTKPCQERQRGLLAPHPSQLNLGLVVLGLHQAQGCSPLLLRKGLPR